MQSQPDSAEKKYAEIAESIRSGEYFRKTRSMYDVSVHDLMTERYLYIVITLLALLIFYIAFTAMRALYPLSTPVPFIFNVNNLVDDIPNIHSLQMSKGEDPSAALLRFFVRNYVTMREEYDINKFDRDVSGVRSQSAAPVFEIFERAIDPRNPASPLTLYQRVFKRTIHIISSKPLEGGKEMEVVYEATVEGRDEAQKSRWQANIAFQYNGLTIDQSTGKVPPVKFTVIGYRTKRLQDIR